MAARSTIFTVLCVIGMAALLAGAPDAVAAGFGYLPESQELPDAPLPDFIVNIINFILILVGVLALAFLVYGGFLYITSRGDEKQVTQAKQIIAYAAIGIVVIGIATAIVNFVIDAVILGPG